MIEMRLDLCESDSGLRFFRVGHSTGVIHEKAVASFDFSITEADLDALTLTEQAECALALADFSFDDWLYRTREFDF